MQEKVVKVASDSTALNAFSKIQTNAVSGVGVIDKQVQTLYYFIVYAQCVTDGGRVDIISFHGDRSPVPRF